MKVSKMLLMLLIVGSVFSIAANMAQAQIVPATVFGPNQYDKPKGSPVTYTETFTPVSILAPHTIWVQNGTGGGNEVKNIAVILNGVTIVDSKDLRAGNPTTKSIDIQQNNTLEVVLKGQGGNSAIVKILCEGCSQTSDIHIDSPIDAGAVNSYLTLVTGSFNTTSGEAGIKVNDAFVESANGRFAANIGFASSGENKITAVITDDEGNTATDTITVNVAESLSDDLFFASVTSGITPLVVDFSINLSSIITSYELDLDGNGVIEQTVSEFSNISYTYQQAGLYLPTVTAVDDQGGRFTYTTAVNALSQVAIDAVFKEKWAGLKTAFINSDIEAVVANFAGAYKDVYREQFTELAGMLETIGNELGTIRMVGVEGNTAEYEIIVTREGVTSSFMLLFAKDDDGKWKILKH